MPRSGSRTGGSRSGPRTGRQRGTTRLMTKKQASIFPDGQKRPLTDSRLVKNYGLAYFKRDKPSGKQKLHRRKIKKDKNIRAKNIGGKGTRGWDGDVNRKKGL